MQQNFAILRLILCLFFASFANSIDLRILNYRPEEAKTEFGEWPNICVVLLHQGTEDKKAISIFAFSGSLIAPGIILTSAHNVAQFQAFVLKVRCGEWNGREQVETKEPQTRFVKSTLIHPLFNSRNLQNDFALLFTEKDFDLTSHIQPIGLPIHGNIGYDPKGCFVMGWGKDAFGENGKYVGILKQVKLDIVYRAECELLLRQTLLGNAFKLHKSFICAGGERGDDACTGDGGGPLVCSSLNNENRDDVLSTHVQVGIVSWGIKCGIEGVPGVYSNLADALCFIQWGSQCVAGHDNFLAMPDCQNWSSLEETKLNQTIADTEQRINDIIVFGGVISPKHKKLIAKLSKNKGYLKNFEDQKLICRSKKAEYA